MASEAIRKSIESSTIKWENVNITQMIRHVTMTYNRSVIERLGLSDVILRPKPRTSFRSFINPTKKSMRPNRDFSFIEY